MPPPTRAVERAPPESPLARTLSLLVVLLSVAVALWPGPFTTGALGHPYGDLADHYWGAWWIAEELRSWRLPLFTRITHQPEGGALWHIDPLGGLFAWFFRSLGMPITWNLLITVHGVAAALLARSIGRSASGSEAGGAAAGVLVATSPYLLGLVHSGLSEYMGLVWPLLFTWTLLEAMEGRRGTRGPVLAFLGCLVQAFYYGAFAVLLGLCLCVGPGWRGRLLTLAKVGAGAATPTMFFMLLPMWTREHAQPAFAPADAPGWSYATLPATDLMSWLRHGPWYHPDTPAMGNPGILHVNHLGVVALALALVGAFAHPFGRALRARALAFMVLALGPVLSWDRHPVRVLGVGVFLPLALAYFPITPFVMVHHPYRMAAFVLPLLALGVATGVARLPRPLAVLAPLAIALEALVASPAPWPLAVTPLPDPAPYEALEGPGAVLDWPPDASTANRRYLMAQVAHGRPIAAGVNTFLSTSVRADPLAARLLRALDNPTRRAQNRDVPPRGPVLVKALEGPSRLGDMGFRWLVLHEAWLSPGELARAADILQSALGPPRASGPGWRIYDLGAPPAPDGAALPVEPPP